MARESRAAHPERERQTWQRQYQKHGHKYLARQKTPEVRASRNKANLSRYHADRDNQVQKLRDRNASPEFKAKRHEYYKMNRAKYQVYKAERRAREASAEGSFTAREWLELCDKHNYTCIACGEKKPLSADHVIPLVRGGSNYITNIQPLCQHCNNSKHTKTIDYR